MDAVYKIVYVGSLIFIGNIAMSEVLDVSGKVKYITAAFVVFIGTIAVQLKLPERED